MFVVWCVIGVLGVAVGGGFVWWVLGGCEFWVDVGGYW